MSFLSRPIKSQFKFHEDIEFITAPSNNEEIILDPTGASIKFIRILHFNANLVLKIAKIDVLKYKFTHPKMITLKVIVQSNYGSILHLDESIALHSSDLHEFKLPVKTETTFNLFTYNNGDHWNGYITAHYSDVEVMGISKNISTIDLSSDPNYTYVFGTNRIRPLPGTADPQTINAGYGMTQAESDAYYKNTTLDGLVNIVGNGFQTFKTPKTISTDIHENDIISYDLELIVQGANGGNNIAANNSDKTHIGYGGRGALLKGIYKDVKPNTLFYLLVGQVGWCNSYADWGASGGGASVIFLDDEFGQYTLQANTSKVTPLMIAGGGAGRYDNGYTTNYNVIGGKYDIANDLADINAKFIDGDINTAMTTTGSSYYTVGGASLGIGYGNGGNSNGRTVMSIALLNNPPSGTTYAYRVGGFGGGGSCYDWGGGGGGLNGGDANQQSLVLFGGTSWIDPNIEVIDRTLVPLDQIIGQRPPQGQIIIKFLNVKYITYQ